MKKQKILFPMTNTDFLRALSNSFLAFLESRTSRSTQKLRPLHGALAEDLSKRLGGAYEIVSLGYGNEKEARIAGRYFDKKVDITILKQGVPVAGIAVKFVMQNYSQNSNNYFENMLGETANIRSNRYPYFQIFIVLEKIPYYESKTTIKGKKIQKWETFTEHNFEKYKLLSKDNIDNFLHTPNKTLLCILEIPAPKKSLETSKDYIEYYKKLNFSFKFSKVDFVSIGNALILNDYENFMEKVYYTIKSQ